MCAGVICCTELIYLLKAAMFHLRFVIYMNMYIYVIHKLKG